MESESLAAAEAGIAAPALPQWVVFNCAGQRLALALERVREIVTPRPFTRLPGARAEVAGLIGVRSRIITAYDLGVVLGGRPAAAAAEHRVLLVDVGERVLGLVVEEVLAVARLAPEALTDDGGAAAGLAVGTASWEGKSAVALELDRVIERVQARNEAN